MCLPLSYTFTKEGVSVSVMRKYDLSCFSGALDSRIIQHAADYQYAACYLQRHGHLGKQHLVVRNNFCIILIRHSLDNDTLNNL